MLKKEKGINLQFFKKILHLYISLTYPYQLLVEALVYRRGNFLIKANDYYF
jgi:hypothetical protein